MEHNLSATVSVRRNPHPSPGPESGSAASGRGNNHHRACMCLVSCVHSANISCVLGSRPTSSTNCMSTSPCYPLSKPRFLALSPKQYECFLSIRGHVCSMLIIVHTANTNISRIFSLGMRQHAQILKRSPACNIVRHLRIVRDICTNIYYYLMFGYLIFKEVLPS